MDIKIGETIAQAHIDHIKGLTVETGTFTELMTKTDDPRIAEAITNVYGDTKFTQAQVTELETKMAKFNGDFDAGNEKENAEHTKKMLNYDANYVKTKADFKEKYGFEPTDEQVLDGSVKKLNDQRDTEKEALKGGTVNIENLNENSVKVKEKYDKLQKEYLENGEDWNIAQTEEFNAVARDKDVLDLQIQQQERQQDLDHEYASDLDRLGISKQ